MVNLCRYPILFLLLTPAATQPPGGVAMEEQTHWAYGLLALAMLGALAVLAWSIHRRLRRDRGGATAPAPNGIGTEPQESTEHRASSSESPSKRILVVDDEPINRTVLRQMLTNGGYEVVEAIDGAQALKSVKDDIQMVLLDVMMPGLSGYEVCRRLRQQYSMQRLPVIFVTAKDRPEDLAEGFAAGGTDYLTKPVHPNDLLERIQAHWTHWNHWTGEA
jgi:CheY-like chemotaxis protein